MPASPLFRALIAFIVSSVVSINPAVRAEAAATTVRKTVKTADDLPRHTYAMPQPPSTVLGEATAFAQLVDAVRKDVAADLAAYDIQDRTTLQRYKGTLLSLALLDADYPTARKLIDELRSLEEKPSLKLTTGLVTEAFIAATLANPTSKASAATMQAALSALAGQLPWGIVQDDLKGTKGGYEVRSEALLVGLAQQQIDPAAKTTGNVSGDVAAQLIGMRNQIVNFLPLKTAIVAALESVIAAHRVEKPDRWTPTLVTLAPTEKAKPVLIGVWDSGVDTAIFRDQLYTDLNGKHGFAFDLHAKPVPALVFPLGEAEARAKSGIARLKGFLDTTASIDSPEATELKRYMSALQPDQVKSTLEDLNLIGNWSHGTHVTGIALAGNPFARLVVGRITFGHTMIPEKPTVEQAHRDAAAYRDAVAYFKRAGVRVVNMSWGGSLRSVEHELEANGVGDANERKRSAREIFDIGRDALLAAFKSAPEILFIASSGNSDNDVKFDEFIPSSFQLPNMITVGAVDQAGEETSFSSFGPMVNVHANGFEVDSYIPGGSRLKFSGTSMASPQVTNLAGKLIALDASLMPESTKALILAGCQKNSRVNLVNEKKSIELLRQKLAAPR